MNREFNWFIDNYRLAYEGRLAKGDLGISIMYMYIHVYIYSTGK